MEQNITEETIIECLKIVKANQYHLLFRKQYWIKRLKTLSPHGINLRTEIATRPTPHIPFIKAFSDYAPSTNKHVRTAFENTKLQHKVNLKCIMVPAHRGKNSKLEKFANVFITEIALHSCFIVVLKTNTPVSFPHLHLSI